jgi:hypothetical protein
MHCTECDAFIAAYKMATEDYSALGESLDEMVSSGHFKTREYQKIITEAEEARLVCEMAREALRVHQEGHDS